MNYDEQLRKAFYDLVASEISTEICRLECERYRRLAVAQQRRMSRGVSAKDLVEMAGLAKSSKVAFLLEARNSIRK